MCSYQGLCSKKGSLTLARRSWIGISWSFPDEHREFHRTAIARKVHRIVTSQDTKGYYGMTAEYMNKGIVLTTKWPTLCTPGWWHEWPVRAQGLSVPFFHLDTFKEPTTIILNSSIPSEAAVKSQFLSNTTQRKLRAYHNFLLAASKWNTPLVHKHSPYSPF